MRTTKTDVLVIGSGSAGMLAAIKAAEKGVNVFLVDKGVIGKSGATVCAAGLAAVGPWHVPEDSVDVHFRDTIIGGKFINNPKLARILVEEAPARIIELEEWGMLFDRESNGGYVLAPTAGHSYTRSLARSDNVGLGIVKVLRRKILQRGTIDIFEDVLVTRLLSNNGIVTGAVAIDERAGDLVAFEAKVVVLATGGIGQLYPATTNPLHSTGDGLALALRAGAKLTDMEQTQFYPVCIVYPEWLKGFSLGISEWGKLYNSERERFMARYDPVNMEAATRDVISKAIYSEIREGRGTEHNGVYLDATEVSQEVFNLFGSKYKYCLARGVDFKRELVEVAPAIHYLMGGVKIDERGQTSLPGLYAAGEVTGGIHGANRLSNNSIIDALVFGARAGENAARHALASRHTEPLDIKQVEGEWERLLELLRRGRRGTRPGRLRAQLQELMGRKVSVVRNKRSLDEALESLTKMEEKLPSLGITYDQLKYNRELREYLEVENMLLVARIIASSASIREESRGAHYLEDYPQRRDSAWLKNTVVRMIAGEVRVSTEPVVCTEIEIEECEE